MNKIDKINKKDKINKHLTIKITNKYNKSNKNKSNKNKTNKNKTNKNKTNKNKTNKNKNKTNKNKTNKTNKILKNKTPKNINELSIQIKENIINKNYINHITKLSEKTYSPTINDLLVSLKSVPREPIFDCNNTEAFNLKERLKIGITDKKSLKNKCLPYNEPLAINQMLKALKANKHVNPNIIVPPIQHLSNCWFNTMFVALFISDKGRKFFHYFRQLMIIGKQANGQIIPNNLRNGFALLNYAIDASLLGNSYAYNLDTNSIIKQIYKSIPEKYKKVLPYLTNVGEASNPIHYFVSLAYYLHNKSIDIYFLQNTSELWKSQIVNYIKSIKYNSKMPHIIIMEYFEDSSMKTTNKAISFSINGAKYELDSVIIRDKTKQHFCCLLTCENKEYAYDGMSYHRLTDMNWKRQINKDETWEFEGSNDLDGTPLKWNFRKGYQMLLYYRVQ
jgi:hypothetical protein